MTDNMPILYRNIMDGLPSQIAKDAFLWAAELKGNDRMCYNAEFFAWEVEKIAKVSRPWFEFAFDQYDSRAKAGGEMNLGAKEDVCQSLMDFMLTRHANYRYGGNKKPTHTGSAQ